jgi:hypothetical protein
VEVFFPKFKLEENYDMEFVLRELGMVDAFEQARADFSGKSSKKELYLSKVIHKSFVEVTGEGTEAAVAIFACARSLCAHILITPRFCAYHPFLFFIQHSKTNGMLFCGHHDLVCATTTFANMHFNCQCSLVYSLCVGCHSTFCVISLLPDTIWKILFSSFLFCCTDILNSF